MKKIVLIVMSMMCSIVVMSAQDVEGVEVGTKMTKEQIIEIFGEPTQYTYKDYGDEGFYERYFYGKNFLLFNYGYFEEFYICDATFTLLKNYIEGGVKVGAPLSVFSDSNFSLRKFTRFRDDEYELYILNYDSPMHIIEESGTIKIISFHFLP